MWLGAVLLNGTAPNLYHLLTPTVIKYFYFLSRMVQLISDTDI